MTDSRPVPITGAQAHDGKEFIWGDVVQGIEEMSHSVTAALLMLQLGNTSTKCFFDQQAVVYQYTYRAAHRTRSYGFYGRVLRVITRPVGPFSRTLDDPVFNGTYPSLPVE